MIVREYSINLGIILVCLLLFNFQSNVDKSFVLLKLRLTSEPYIAKFPLRWDAQVTGMKDT